MSEKNIENTPSVSETAQAPVDEDGASNRSMAMTAVEHRIVEAQFDTLTEKQKKQLNILVDRGIASGTNLVEAMKQFGPNTTTTEHDPATKDIVITVNNIGHGLDKSLAEAEQRLTTEKLAEKARRYKELYGGNQNTGPKSTSHTGVYTFTEQITAGTDNTPPLPRNLNNPVWVSMKKAPDVHYDPKTDTDIFPINTLKHRHMLTAQFGNMMPLGGKAFEYRLPDDDLVFTKRDKTGNPFYDAISANSIFEILWSGAHDREVPTESVQQVAIIQELWRNCLPLFGYRAKQPVLRYQELTSGAPHITAVPDALIIRDLVMAPGHLGVPRGVSRSVQHTPALAEVLMRVYHNLDAQYDAVRQADGADSPHTGHINDVRETVAEIRDHIVDTCEVPYPTIDLQAHDTFLRSVKDTKYNEFNWPGDQVLEHISTPAAVNLTLKYGADEGLAPVEIAHDDVIDTGSSGHSWDVWDMQHFDALEFARTHSFLSRCLNPTDDLEGYAYADDFYDGGVRVPFLAHTQHQQIFETNYAAVPFRAYSQCSFEMRKLMYYAQWVSSGHRLYTVIPYRGHYRVVRFTDLFEGFPTIYDLFEHNAKSETPQIPTSWERDYTLFRSGMPSLPDTPTETGTIQNNRLRQRWHHASATQSATLSATQSTQTKSKPTTITPEQFNAFVKEYTGVVNRTVVGKDVKGTVVFKDATDEDSDALTDEASNPAARNSL